MYAHKNGPVQKIQNDDVPSSVLQRSCTMSRLAKIALAVQLTRREKDHDVINHTWRRGVAPLHPDDECTSLAERFIVLVLVAAVVDRQRTTQAVLHPIQNGIGERPVGRQRSPLGAKNVSAEMRISTRVRRRTWTPPRLLLW